MKRDLQRSSDRHDSGRQGSGRQGSERHSSERHGQASYQAFLAVIKLAGVLRKAGDRFFRTYGLTQSQFNILMVLNYGHPRGCTQTEVCHQLLVRPANMTVLMRRLEANGLVDRAADPADERAWKVTISPQGRKLLQTVEPGYHRTVDRIMGAHSDRALKTLFRQLERTQEAIAREAI